jgi:hypothetical protein
MKLNFIFILKIILCILTLHSCTEFTTKTKTETNTKTETKNKSTFKTKTETKSENKLSFRAKMSFFKTKTKKSNNKNTPVIITSDIHWRGWIKYFKIKRGERPKSFYKNYYYYKQMKDNDKIDLNALVDGSYEYIRDDNYFYVSLLDDNIIISNSRKDNFNTIFDSVKTDLIAPVLESGNEGGIQDFGKFSEGFCFKTILTREKLNEILSDKTPTTEYVFCCETAKEKDVFMKKIKKIKMNKQIEEGKLFAKHAHNVENIANLMNKNSPLIKDPNNENNFLSKDGHWVIIQDWSECSVKCGGGESLLQRFCVPPIGDGKDCEGENIIRKPCNEVPCEAVNF